MSKRCDSVNIDPLKTPPSSRHMLRVIGQALLGGLALGIGASVGHQLMTTWSNRRSTATTTTTSRTDDDVWNMAPPTPPARHPAYVTSPTTATADQLILFHGTHQKLPHRWFEFDETRPIYTVDWDVSLEPTFVYDLSLREPSLVDVIAPASLAHVLLPLCTCCTLSVVNDNLALLDDLHALMRPSGTLVIKHPNDADKHGPELNGFVKLRHQFCGVHSTFYTRVDKAVDGSVASAPLFCDEDDGVDDVDAGNDSPSGPSPRRRRRRRRTRRSSVHMPIM
jgi:hypothetical protein